ncbi:substrate-binding periplasmic protein [Chromobacterium phragmitis]|uniref:substrate-binding periplasmic protein n=1 Tax=Chromobacterium phragmitis TaxID=2202141 RepID=UPI0011AE4432|nr:transporter substrate-binding domain-containing protein [Chromobacterium phragmitis]
MSGTAFGATVKKWQPAEKVAMIRGLWLLMLVATTSVAASLPPLVLLTEDDPPLTYSASGKPAGMVVEIVREIQRRVGSRDAIEVMPWARAYRLAQSKADTALFNTNRIREREGMFKWVGPVTMTSGSLFVRQDSHARADSLDEAKRLSQILVVRDWYLQQVLIDEGFSNLGTVATPNQMITMLMLGRTEVIASENTTLPIQLRQQGYRGNEVRKLLTFTHTYGYIAFSKITSDQVVRTWQRALEDMKRDGSFAAIYHRWLPGEQVPD